MSNKNRQTDSNGKGHNWLDVFARTRRSSSDLNSDEQWHSEVPNIKTFESICCCFDSSCGCCWRNISL